MLLQSKGFIYLLAIFCIYIWWKHNVVVLVAIDGFRLTSLTPCCCTFNSGIF